MTESHGHDEHGHDEHGHDEHEHDDHGHGHGDHGHDEHSGVLGRLRALVVPHSHDAADTYDTALTASREGMRTLKISLAGLAVTAALQIVVVVISGSVALLADTIHNFADALTAIPLGVAFILGRRAATRRYTYGYGRAEDLAGVFILVAIAASAAVAAWVAVQRLFHPQEVNNVGWVAVAGVIGFVGNELVATYRIRTGRRIGSAALVADGLHARTDGLTSLAVVLGAVGTLAGWRLADPIIGLLISIAILAVLRGAARDIYRRLMDSVDPALVDRVEQVVAHVAGVHGVDGVRVRWIGHELHADIEISVDEHVTLVEAHNLAEETRHQLLHQVPRLADALIHVSPVGDAHNLTAHHFTETRPPRNPDRAQRSAGRP